MIRECNKCHRKDCDGNCDQTIRAVYIGDEDTFDLATIPKNAEIMMRLPITDEASGATRWDIIYVTPAKLQGLSSHETVFTFVNSHNPNLKIEKGQVMAARYESQADGTVMIVPADPDHPAQFVIVRQDDTDPLRVVVMVAGVAELEEDHGLIPGCDYYVGAGGEPLTSGNQKMLTASEDNKVLINLR